MRADTYTYEMEFSEEGTMSTVELEEAEYRSYASLLGIEPSAPSSEAAVQVDAREVEKLKAMAAFKDADPHDAEGDAYYERHRSMILGGMA